MTDRGVRRLDPDRLGDHVDRLYRAAWSLCGRREDAEDLVQETYAKVLQKERKLHGEDELGYLLRTLRNVFISNYRTAQRRPKTQEMAEGYEPEDPRAGLRPDRAAETGEVFAVISRLPEEFRDAIVAVDVVGLSYAEAGDLMGGVPEKTVATRLFRARKRVAAEMAA